MKKNQYSIKDVFAGHKDQRCRELFYRIMIKLWSKFESAPVLQRDVEGILLKGLVDNSPEIRSALFKVITEI